MNDDTRSRPNVSPIPFCKASIEESDEDAVLLALQDGLLSGDGKNGRDAEALLRQLCGVSHALLTTSCTHALELSMLALELAPGDEVILPSFTFSSTANAIVLRGATPVFCEIDEETWNLDPRAVTQAITQRTRGIVPVHYAGQGCDMDSILAIAQRYNLWVVEDAAQGLGASHRGRPLGSMGSTGCLSFHQTKNIVCGEGGALLTNDTVLCRRAEMIREKGTNRSAFFRGEVDKYTWVDIGSSYVISDLLGALLKSQLGRTSQINDARMQRWRKYHEALFMFEQRGDLRRPVVRSENQINGHIYAIVVDPKRRDRILDFLRKNGVGATFHYVPLHSAPYAKKLGISVELPITDRISGGLIRLPLFATLSEAEQDYSISMLEKAFAQL